MEKRQVAQKAVLLWQIRATAAGCAGGFFCGALFALVPHVALVLSALLLGCYLLVLFWYCRARYQNSLYAVGEHALWLEYGVLIHREFYLEFDKVQYISLSQTPAQKCLKLCTVVFWTACA